MGPHRVQMTVVKGLPFSLHCTVQGPCTVQRSFRRKTVTPVTRQVPDTLSGRYPSPTSGGHFGNSPVDPSTNPRRKSSPRSTRHEPPWRGPRVLGLVFSDSLPRSDRTWSVYRHPSVPSVVRPVFWGTRVPGDEGRPDRYNDSYDRPVLLSVTSLTRKSQLSPWPLPR